MGAQAVFHVGLGNGGGGILTVFREALVDERFICSGQPKLIQFHGPTHQGLSLGDGERG